MNYNIKCTPIKNGNYNVVGLASVVVDDKLMVNNIQLIQNDNNYEIHYPSRKSNKTNTGYTTIAFPADVKLKKKIMSAIITSFKKGGENVSVETETPYELSTKVSLFDRDNIRGFCRVSFSKNNEFRFNDIFLREGSKGVFVDFPSYRTNKVDDEGKPVYNSVINPYSKEYYAELKDDLLAKYNELSLSEEPEFENEHEEEIDDEEEEDMDEPLLFR